MIQWGSLIIGIVLGFFLGIFFSWLTKEPLKLNQEKDKIKSKENFRLWTVGDLLTKVGCGIVGGASVGLYYNFQIRNVWVEWFYMMFIGGVMGILGYMLIGISKQDPKVKKMSNRIFIGILLLISFFLLLYSLIVMLSVKK